MTTDISADVVMSQLRAQVRERLRQRLVEHGGAAAYADPDLFADAERMLQAALAHGDAAPLLLPELLGDPDTWRLRTAMHYESHRGGAAGASLVFVKRRLLMPLLRWLFEYNRDNFERQRRVNRVLFACVQELAFETARLRQEVHRLSAAAPGRGADRPE